MKMSSSSSSSTRRKKMTISINTFDLWAITGGQTEQAGCWLAIMRRPANGTAKASWKFSKKRTEQKRGTKWMNEWRPEERRKSCRWWWSFVNDYCRCKGNDDISQTLANDKHTYTHTHIHRQTHYNNKTHTERADRPPRWETEEQQKNTALSAQLCMFLSLSHFQSPLLEQINL